MWLCCAEPTAWMHPLMQTTLEQLWLPPAFKCAQRAHAAGLLSTNHFGASEDDHASLMAELCRAAERAPQPWSTWPWCWWRQSTPATSAPWRACARTLRCGANVGQIDNINGPFETDARALPSLSPATWHIGSTAHSAASVGVRCERQGGRRSGLYAVCAQALQSVA